jgi:cellulose synthase/poly-beta-1,6-N-acetylglucosamine synthase-like glycosyltransferase
MDIGISLLLVMSFGWVLTIFQYVLPLYSRFLLEKDTIVKSDTTIKKRVTVLLPCFNEGSHAYDTIQSICDSDYPHELIEVIAVDDHSTDDSWDWIQKALADHKTEVKLTAFRQPQNSGKYEALLRGAKLAADAEIFICIDSDCTFDKHAITELVGSFVTDQIAAVGGHVCVSNVNQNLLTQAQTLVYFYAYHVMKMFQNYIRNVTCISGCLFAIRREAFFAIAPDVAACNFLGAKFSAGEDRYMTHLLILNEYHTCVNLEAKCWTEVPSQYKKFFLQQWRWRRSGIQDYLLTLKTFKRHTEVLNPLSIINLILPETVNYILLFSMLFAAAQGQIFNWVVAHQLFSLSIMGPFVLWVAWFMKRVSPDQLPKSSPLILLPLITAWALTGTFLCAFLALFTMDSSSWGTRTPTKVSK